ncbi:MAG: MarR family winged helix-turn-helix transcriptional regulator [Halioglobus sp.]
MAGSSQMRSEIGQTLMLLTRDFQRRLDADLKARGVQGIGARHRDVFLFLGRNGASRAVDLAQSAGIRPQSMMKIVHELEALGMLERRVDPADSRAKLIDFTQQGREFIRELSRSTETVWRQYVALLGEAEALRTFNNLNRLLAGETTSDE